MNGTSVGATRFGVFVQGRGLYDWERRSIEVLEAAGATGLLISADAEASSTLSNAARYLHDLILSAAGVPGRADANRIGKRDRQHRSSVIYSFERATTGALRLAPAQRALLCGQGLQFILFFGSGTIPDGMPACAKLGVWQFMRTEGAAGTYPFVHEFHSRQDVVSFGLEQVTGDGARPRALLTGHFRARGERNLTVARQVLAQASRWPLHVLKHVELNGDLPRCEQHVVANRSRVGDLELLLSLHTRDALMWLFSTFASYFVLETWTVGLLRMNFRSLLAGSPLAAVTLLPRLGFGTYIADPFILATSPDLTLLVEDYNDFGVGRISEVTVRDPFGTPEIGMKVCLESGHHMSYPFVFREEGITYCLPECHQSNASLLYRHETGKLTPVAELLPGARATDGTILFHEGLYWLFCGLEDDNDQVNLHLYFSKSLRGNWSAHPLNPVKTDVRSSRSGGPIIHRDGELYRPAQDCSRSYGYGLSINRIDCLTPTRFDETVVSVLRPEAISGRCKGLHTLSIADDLMVIDAKFHLLGFEPVMVRALRRLKRMRGGLTRTARRLWWRSAPLSGS